MQYTKALADLIEEFRKFPGVGPRSAQRMAFSYLKKTPEQAQKFLEIFRLAKETIKYCKQCFNLTTDNTCEICLDSRRDKAYICVVETVKDLIAIERTHGFRGLYHVLGGVISPLDGIGIEDLTINNLFERVVMLDLPDVEIILALGLSTEGEATMLYLRRLLGQIPNRKITITRLAHGLPVGADLDYTDEVTLIKALEARVLV